ncbi:glutathione S-transferase theta-1-like [Culicoides brevitarsis]|uniref:glutathione S-transferase theta-1-like n=1 Tax=Culicoides brevitarsis TaxID=469753 RepID=UPI00307B61F5
MAAPFKFFYDLMSPPTRALYILFNHLRVPYEPVKIALRRSEHLTDEFQKNVHRLSLMPVIHHNGLRLSESVAILHYLAREKILPAGNSFFPLNDDKTLARIDEYLEWTHNNMRLGAGMLFRLKWITPFITGEKPSPKEVKRYEKIFEQSLNTLENVWLEEQKFIAGNKITYADILAACDIEQTKIAGYHPLKNRPKLHDWLETVRKETNPVFDEGHKYIYKYAEQYKGDVPVKSSL